MSETSEAPRRTERRSPIRVTDTERYHLARTAIEVAKGQDSKGFNAYLEEIDMMDRVSAQQVKNGQLTEAERSQFMKEFLAMRQVADSLDPLTNVYDRPSTIRQVNKILEVPPEESKQHVYIDFDINKLKAMNDESLNKHQSADEALKAFAGFHNGRITERFGYLAKFGRLSGDEFTCIIPNTTIEEVKAFFEEIEPDRHIVMAKIKEREGLPVDITAMRGVVFAQPNERFEDVHNRADALLNEQKMLRNQKELSKV